MKRVHLGLIFCAALESAFMVHGWVRGPTRTSRRTRTCNSRGPLWSLPSTSIKDITTDATLSERLFPKSPLSLTIQELTPLLGGKGRAQVCWDCLKLGVDPLWFHGTCEDKAECHGSRLLLNEAAVSIKQQIAKLLPKRRQTEGMGDTALCKYQQVFNKSIEETIADLVHVNTSKDGTVKLLLQMHPDGLQVETVIIPWPNRQKSTLCISSQAGCKQACTFCATGQMGKLRSLTCDEILVQVYWAQRACRMNHDLYPIENIVFMGMGEPADNVDNVVRACHVLTNAQLFQIPSRHVCVSTVGPTPESFLELSKAPVSLAWSVHACRNDLRKQLVPTTRYSMETLRDEGLIPALLQKQGPKRRTMLEITLLDQVNDSEQDALDLVQFCQPIRQQGIPLVVNLIPWNDVSTRAATYRQPTMERVYRFQKVLLQHNVQCYIRTTRGDDESAACGQLATSKSNRGGTP